MGNGLCGGYEARIEREEEYAMMDKIIKLKKLIDENPDMVEKLVDALLNEIDSDLSKEKEEE